MKRTVRRAGLIAPCLLSLFYTIAGWAPSVRFLSAVAAATHGKLLIALDCGEVSLNFTSWNQLDGWLRQVDLRRAA